MLTATLSVLVIVVPILVALAVSWIAFRRIRHEPRRWSNAYWLLAAVLLVVQTLADLGAPGAGAVTLGIGLLVLTAPLLVLVLTAFLIMNGLTMLRRESRSLGNLLSLLAGLALAALVIVSVPVLLTGNIWLILALAVVMLVAAYLGFQFVAFAGYGLLYPRLVRNRPADWVIVLGSGLGRDGRVPPLLASRVRTGIEEFKRRGARTLIVSGGKGNDEIRPEADAMAEWAIDNGADPQTVLLESRSRNTEQNLRFSRELLLSAAPISPALASGEDLSDAVTDRESGRGPDAGDGSVAAHHESPGLVVTSNYHVMRAAILARQLGIPAQAAGAPTAGYYWPSAMIREYIAILAERPILHIVLAAAIALPVPLLLIAVHVFSW